MTLLQVVVFIIIDELGLLFLPMRDLMDVRRDIKFVLLRTMLNFEGIYWSSIISCIYISKAHFIWLGPILVSLFQPCQRLAVFRVLGVTLVYLPPLLGSSLLVKLG